MKTSLKHAIENNQFFLVFQPKIDLSTEKFNGFEVFIRWRTPEGNIIYPSQFIKIAEETGLHGEVVELIGVYSFYRMNQVILAYHVRAEGQIRLGEELAEVKRVPPAKLQPWPHGTGMAVRDWLVARNLLSENGTDA